MSAEPLAERYDRILREYLRDANEVSRADGYELARRALADGDSLLDIALIHHRSLRRLLTEGDLDDEVLRKAGDFFTESLSPFEMSHRGAQEGTRALRYVNEVLESELKRIAHALHDEAGQLLASVHIALSDIAANVPSQARKRFDDVQQLLRQIEAELRGLSHELRPTVLDNLGLLPALEFLAEKVAKRTGLAVSVNCEGERRLPTPVETALYRVVQEALNNAARHAQAKSVQIDLQYTPSKVECRVQDDGVGFVPRKQSDSQTPDSSQGLGLLGIHERLNVLNGELRVETEPRRGTTIVASIPLGDRT